MEGDSRNLLQHPRRNLGNRYRSQARKFTKLATTDDTRFADNISWAEQSARQAILYDFTEEENWRCLAEIKVILGDAEGLSSLLEDVFSILGRDPEQVEQFSARVRTMKRRNSTATHRKRRETGRFPSSQDACG